MSPKRNNLIYGLLILFSLAPLVLTLLSLGIAQLNGCAVSANDVQPCLVFGQDIGSLLLLSAFLGAFTAFTLPTGIMAMVGLKIYTTIKNKPAIVK
jgi:hypothetical protein